MLLMTFFMWAPLAAAAVIFFTGQRRISRIAAWLFSTAIGVSTLLFSGVSLTVKGMDYSIGSIGAGFVLAVGIAAAFAAAALSAWRRRPLCLLLAAIQLILFFWNDRRGLLYQGDAVFFADRLSLIGVLLAGVVGSALCAGLVSQLVKTKKGKMSAVWGYGLLPAVMALVLCDDVTLLPGLMGTAGLLACLLAESGEVEKRTGEKRTIEKQTAENRPTEKRTIEKQTAENRPTEKRTIENHMTEKQMAENHMIEKQVTEKQTVEKQTVEKGRETQGEGSLKNGKIRRRFGRTGGTMGYSILSAALLAGIFVQLALPVLSQVYQILSVSRLAAAGASGVSIIFPLTLLTLAGLALGAQSPFSLWMLQENGLHERGQALLKGVGLPAAGIYLLLRLSPALGGTMAGTIAALSGGLTLLCMGVTAWKTGSKQAFAPGALAAAALLSAISAATAFWSGLLLLLYSGISIALWYEGKNQSGLAAAGGGGLLLTLAGLTLVRPVNVTTLAHQDQLLPLLVLFLSLFLLAAAYAPVWGRMGYVQKKSKRRKGFIAFLCCPLLVMDGVCLAGLPILSQLAVTYTTAQFPAVAMNFSQLTRGDGVLAVILLITTLALWASNRKGAQASGISGAEEAPATWNFDRNSGSNAWNVHGKRPWASQNSRSMESFRGSDGIEIDAASGSDGEKSGRERDELGALASHINQFATVLMALITGLALAVLWGGVLS